MPGKKISPLRFAHLDGHTDVCYNHDGRLIITCGLDGDIRIFEGLHDNDCVTHTVAEHVHCIAFKDDCIIAGTDFNIVQSYTLDEGKPNGIITRCTAYPTHINISKDKKLIAVASSDMTVKVHDSENFQDIIFCGHEAPVLSVALDPKRDFLATSSCDGTVRVWNFRTQTEVRSFSLLPRCNNFTFSPTLCRLSWSLDGQYLFVPVNLELQVFNRVTWKLDFVLSHPSITKAASTTAVSPCGKYVCLGCQDGRLIVWNIQKRSCIITEQSPKSMAISGLAWHPGGKEEIAFVNNSGELGVLQDFLSETSCDKVVEEKQTEKTETEANGVDDSFPPLNLPDDDDDDESSISIAKIKSQLGFGGDEGVFSGLPEPTDEDNVTRASSRMDTPLPTPQVVAPALPDPQKPFQPGMSPDHLNDRYMIWNNTGIVRQYQSEEEQSIEVEFHDSSVHHAMHLNNLSGHSMAALNDEALVLATESQNEQLSKLVVHHFSAWDGSKEWQMEFNEGEDILALTVGIGWVAAATDLRNLRVFTVTGIQKDVLSIPGPVVCLAGFEKRIMVVYHSGIGAGGEQSLSLVLWHINNRKDPISTPVPIPLSPNSFLAWAGFTDEGTPMIVDSVGVVRLFNKNFGQSWTPVLNTKAHAKGKSDHYFILGASEIQGVIRCILCKGARYPPVLPRPHVSPLDFKIPLCDPDDEKSCLEEKVIWSKRRSTTISDLGRKGFDIDHLKSETESALKETLVKLFAMACSADRESRAVDICELMPSAEMVEVALRYASKLHRMQLAQKLNGVIEAKMQEKYASHYGNTRDSDDHSFDDNDFDNQTYEKNSEVVTTSSSSSSCSNSKETNGEIQSSNPLLAATEKLNSRKGNFDDHLSFMRGKRNPFKKDASASSSARGIQVLDNLKLAKKEDSNFPILKPVLKKPRVNLSKKSVSSNSVIKETSSVDTDKAATSVGMPIVKKSALKLWQEDHQDMLIEKFPSASEAELLAKSALIFKDEDESVKQDYKARAAALSQPEPESKEERGESTSEIEKKRKPQPSKCEPVDKKTKKVESKLSAFAFSKTKG